jgi:2-polyprenyl-6-methoxyphenol hydroxylase-like FAD-dependent oxidoreductase
MAGLLAARVLHDHYREIVVLDRDAIPSGPHPRKGVPQSYHPHILLAQGLARIEELFPGICAELLAAGAHRGGPDVWRIVTPAGVVLPSERGHHSIGATRALIEWCVRCRVAALPSVRLVAGSEVVGLTTTADRRRVTGVQVRARHARSETEVIAADLVVDASGRHSKALDWLTAAGYRPPAEERVTAGVGYSSRMYRIPYGTPATWPNLLIQPRPPHNPRLGILMAVEHERWHVLLGGIAAHDPPTEEAAFLAWAQALPDPSLYESIRLAEPVSPVRGFRIPTTHLRHLGRVSRWPGGFIVMRDAVCAFNPIYAQGMTVAALEATALDDVLRERPGIGWERHFQQRVAGVVADPWRMATHDDLRWPGVQLNGKPAGSRARLAQRYLDVLLPAACSDPLVSRAFLAATSMQQPATALLRPRVLVRVAWHALRGTGVPTAAQQALTLDALAELRTRNEAAEELMKVSEAGRAIAPCVSCPQPGTVDSLARMSLP